MPKLALKQISGLMMANQHIGREHPLMIGKNPLRSTIINMANISAGTMMQKKSSSSGGLPEWE